jgi:hypothetical protein
LSQPIDSAAAGAFEFALWNFPFILENSDGDDDERAIMKEKQEAMLMVLDGDTQLIDLVPEIIDLRAPR